ncbi:hypothetical protein [Salinisphaera sp.]|uniref:DUF883 family protein n=1 Tax=Salinisphaera sp. TaxID=1914330 RepID=UPI002D793736|nr:hypothetical protein [Salinisphaera sp.]HET7315096.1 hypothetical protein [Salinisphaera sp.]
MNETDALKKDLDALRKDLRELAESVRSSGEQRYQDGLDQARHTYEDLRSQASKRSQEVGAEIEARPFTSVFAAFGIGLVLGKLLR